MRKFFYIAAFSLMALSLSSCHEEKKSDNIIAHKIIHKPHKTISKVGDKTDSREIKWLGATYRVVISRKADTSLPIIDDGSGNRYYDNEITLKIVRQDGSEFFNRTFTKNAFKDNVPSRYKGNKGGLVAIMFNKAEGDNLLFAVTVGSPDSASEDYIPLTLTVSRLGAVGISKDNGFDAAPVSSDEE